MRPKPLVLVVDDSAFDRQWMQDQLIQCGYAVETLNDGMSALERMTAPGQAIPAIVLMDAVMPIMDGFSACKAIKELPLDQTVPVLMVTGFEDAASIDRAFDAGAEDYIVKPVNIVLLNRRIDRIIRTQAAEACVRDMAYRDPLTGLPNRRRFQDELERRISLALPLQESLAVVFLDLDKFKQVNDRWGHASGDLVLQEVGRRFLEWLHPKDFIARLGGDEFMMIFSGIGDAETIVPLMQKIVQACEAPVCCEGAYVEVGVSIGVSFFPADGSEVLDLMRKADMAMYCSKAKSGSVHTCYQAGRGVACS